MFSREGTAELFRVCPSCSSILAIFIIIIILADHTLDRSLVYNRTRFTPKNHNTKRPGHRHVFGPFP